MNSSSDVRGSASALRIAGVGLGVLGAFGGVAGWFTLAGQDAATTSITGSGGTVVADGSSVGQGTGQAHTTTSGS
jgi:hypothetical protein